MNTVTIKNTKLQILVAHNAMRDALDQERTARRSAEDTIEALRAEIKALRIEIVGADSLSTSETPCEVAKAEETTAPEAEKAPTTIAEFCAWYCRVNGAKSVPKAAVETWKNAFARVCIKCNGSGRYVYADGGYGDCYACTGRGKQTHSDVTRCSNYWKLYGQP